MKKGRRNGRGTTPPSWLNTSADRRLVARVKRPLAFLVTIGKSDQFIRRRLQLSQQRLESLLEHEEVQAAITLMETHLGQRDEKAWNRLFRKSIRWMDQALDARDVLGLRAVELLWAALGRVAQKGGDTITEQHTNLFVPYTHDQAREAIAILREQRARRTAELEAKTIETTAVPPKKE